MSVQYPQEQLLSLQQQQEATIKEEVRLFVIREMAREREIDTTNDGGFYDDEEEDDNDYDDYDEESALSAFTSSKYDSEYKSSCSSLSPRPKPKEKIKTTKPIIFGTEHTANMTATRSIQLDINNSQTPPTARAVIFPFLPFPESPSTSPYPRSLVDPPGSVVSISSNGNNQTTIATTSTKNAIPVATVIQGNVVTRESFLTDDFPSPQKFYKTRCFRWLYRCALIVLFVGILVPLVIFARQYRQSGAEAFVDFNSNSSPEETNTNSHHQCLDEILLLDPENQSPAPPSGLCFSKNTYQEKASFDLSLHRCNSDTDTNSTPGGLKSSDNDDWIGIFPSQANTLSRLWVANSWGAFLVCNGETENENDGFMQPTMTQMNQPCLFAPPTPTPPLAHQTSRIEEDMVVQVKATTMSMDIDIDIDSDMVPPGHYRFFLVKGGSGWPYEYKAYSESFRIVATPEVCKQQQEKATIAIHDYDDAEFRTITSGSKPSNNVFRPEQQQQQQDIQHNLDLSVELEDTNDNDGNFFGDEQHLVHALFRPFLPPSEDLAAASSSTPALPAMINNDFFDDESNTKVYYWRDIFGDDDGDGNGDG